MNIENLTYKQFALIRESIIEKREKLWKTQIEEPFRKALRKMSFDEVKKIKKEFDTNMNQFRNEGICNKILENIDKIEIDLQKELGKK